MTKDILNIDTPSTTKSKSKITKKTDDTKTTSSLFDKILSQNSKTINTNTTTSQTNLQDIKTTSKSVSKNLNTKTNIETKTASSIKPTSLLDNMINKIKTKNNIINKDEIKINPTLAKEKINSSEVIKVSHEVEELIKENTKISKNTTTHKVQPNDKSTTPNITKPTISTPVEKLKQTNTSTKIDTTNTDEKQVVTKKVKESKQIVATHVDKIEKTIKSTIATDDNQVVTTKAKITKQIIPTQIEKSQKTIKNTINTDDKQEVVKQDKTIKEIINPQNTKIQNVKNPIVSTPVEKVQQSTTKTDDKQVVVKKDKTIKAIVQHKDTKLENVKEQVVLTPVEKIQKNTKHTIEIDDKKQDSKIDKSFTNISTKEETTLLDSLIKTATTHINKQDIKENAKEDLSTVVLSTKDVQKDIDNPTTIQDNKTNSLMDSLINSSKKQLEKEVKISDNKVEKSLDTKLDTKNITNTIAAEQTPKTVVDTKENLKAKSYIHSQKVEQNIISKVKIKESKDILIKDNSLNIKQKVQKSADTLELNIEKSELIVEEEKIQTDNEQQKKMLKTKVTKHNNFLDKVFLNQNIQKNIIDEKIITTIKDEKNVQAQEIKEQDQEIKTDIKLTVENTTAQNIVNKIIDAKQKISSFMSDLSRQMYQNYKPPLTAFRIKLNPANLGSIAIVMKSNKTDNSMSISMNISSSATYDTMQSNKDILQNNLQNNFENIKEFIMDFSNNEDNSNNEQNNQNKQKNNTTKEQLEENETIVNPTSDYM
jgi:hypothetical protein